MIAENIRSTHNVGAFFRTADALGVDKIFLCGYTPCPPRKEISKVALGAEQTVPWEQRKRTAALLQKLRREHVRLVALEFTPAAVPLHTFRPRFPLALIVGNEVTGVEFSTLKFADQVVKIPMRGEKESLNVSVAAGIALYALTLRRS